VNYFKVEVILPFHVNDKHLSDALESTLFALPANSRIIAVNTISQSKLLPENNLIREVFAPGAGYFEALRTGLNVATSKYVALMNSDDLCEPKRFLKQLEALEISASQVCMTGIKKFSEEKTFLPTLVGEPPKRFVLPMLLLGSYYSDASWMFEREIALTHDFFSANLDYSDWTLGMRILKQCKVIYISERLYFYRMHENQLTRRKENDSDAFYSAWRELNNSYGLPSLSNSEIRILAKPWLLDSSVKSLSNIDMWIKEFSKNNTGLNLREKLRVKQVIARRLLFYFYATRQGNFGFRNFFYLPRLFFEYLYLGKFLR
jgi:glycosyltransferase involved in cell wall biosynthesis